MLTSFLGINTRVERGAASALIMASNVEGETGVTKGRKRLALV